MFKYEVFSGPYFLGRTEYGEIEFSPNVGKYGPEKTPYLDTFHAVIGTSNTSSAIRRYSVKQIFFKVS